MKFSESWRVGFELELILGDLNDPRFEYFNSDPMDVASQQYCRAVAADLTRFTGKRWLAAQKKQRRTGYFVYPEYDLDPLDWPEGTVAGVELVTPPLPIAEADDLRRQIAEWVYEVDGDINAYPSRYSLGSGWHINIDPGEDSRRIDEPRILLGTDELPLLLSSRRYPSQYAAPQRHAYGAPLLRYIRTPGSRPLLDKEMGNFLRHYGGRGKRYAINRNKLESGYLELRHFGSEWFFREQPLEEIIASFLEAAECTGDSYRLREQRLLATFDHLSSWISEVAPRMAYRWEAGHSLVNIVGGEVQFDGDKLADIRWSGTADYSLQTATKVPGPSIYDQPFPDLPLSLAVLALDIAEIRGRKIGKLLLANKAFSGAVDQLTKSLKRSGLLTPPPLEQSVFWTPHPWDEERFSAETGVGRQAGQSLENIATD